MSTYTPLDLKIGEIVRDRQGTPYAILHIQSIRKGRLITLIDYIDTRNQSTRIVYEGDIVERNRRHQLTRPYYTRDHTHIRLYRTRRNSTFLYDPGMMSSIGPLLAPDRQVGQIIRDTWTDELYFLYYNSCDNQISSYRCMDLDKLSQSDIPDRLHINTLRWKMDDMLRPRIQYHPVHPDLLTHYRKLAKFLFERSLSKKLIHSPTKRKVKVSPIKVEKDQITFY